MKGGENQYKNVRVRIAPSPTGNLHLGTARTALFNYIFAKHFGGKFILRIEDTDRERSKPEFEKDIIEGLEWLGVTWDEGPIRQTERMEIYSKYIEKLLSEDKAYYCFCSEAELEAQKQYQMSMGEAPHYTGKCAGISKKDAEKKRAEGAPCVIRFRVPAKKVVFNDLIRGKVEFDSALSGDIVIAKSLDAPLYNFAVVIDDHEMNITHIIRGEDHISNTPKQILLQEALGFSQPVYAHLPLILGTDRSKLSKRHGAVSLNEYKKQGYLPEAMVNFMAFLGWNPGGEKEIYSMQELIKDFSIENVQKGGAIFNMQRLDYLNGFYIRQKSIKEITLLCLPYLIETGFVEPSFQSKEFLGIAGMGKEIVSKYKVAQTGEEISFEYLEKIVGLYSERLKKISEISELTSFFFQKELAYDKELLLWKKYSQAEIKQSLENTEQLLSKIDDKAWKKENLEKFLMPEAEVAGDRGKVLWPLRASLTGKTASAGPFDIAALLGKEKTLERIKEAVKKL